MDKNHTVLRNRHHHSVKHKVSYPNLSFVFITYFYLIIYFSFCIKIYSYTVCFCSVLILDVHNNNSPNTCLLLTIVKVYYTISNH